MFIISRCLLGENCKYDGGNNFNEEVIEFCKNHSYYSVCPEEAGGLPTPRKPAEYVDGKIINNSGEDVTENFVNGARLSYDEAYDESKNRNEKIEGAILKAKSPSCGVDVIYNGNFDGTEVAGDGAFVKLLKSHGIKVISEKELRNGKF